MNGFSNGVKWITAAALVMSMTVAPAFAAKSTPATDKNTNVPAVPRAIPDLIPYHKFDPPKSGAFDLKKLTVSGDIRVRPEFRNNQGFTKGTANSFFVQQWVRIGFNYAISPDVDFFFQPQYAKAFGGAAAVDANSSAGTVFTRQAFMLIRNFGIKNLTAKIGRQLVVWGNHRMFGHFDWNNVGFAHDGASLNYKLSKNITLQTAWIRSTEGDCGPPAIGGGCAGGSARAGTDADIVFLRAPMKFMGVVMEPVWIWHSGGTGGALAGARPSNQSRHTIGARVTTKKSLSRVMVDVTGEGYYQFGEIGIAGGALGREMDISAFAIHVDGGVTLPVPMQPRIGAEFNMASGDSSANTCTGGASVAAGTCNSDWQGFDQLFPTNHIHFGYMDRMSWKNMVTFSGTLQLRPTKKSHLEFAAHAMYLNVANDNWYSAGQGVFKTSAAGNTEDDLGTEIDAVYTLFFTPGNHVGWQIGGGVFLPGDYSDQLTQNGPDASAESWGYTQLWINF